MVSLCCGEDTIRVGRRDDTVRAVNGWFRAPGKPFLMSTGKGGGEAEALEFRVSKVTM